MEDHVGLGKKDLRWRVDAAGPISIALNKAGMDPDEPFLLERFEVVRHHECRM